MSQRLDQILQEVQALSVEEREQLLVVLGGRQLTDGTRTPEDLAEANMLAKGIISRIPPPPTAADIARHRSIVPVAVEGKPVSESLIEDRR